MLLDKSSLTVVLLGDWNKLYIQPDWIANNVYCQKEIEIGLLGQGTDLSITYRCNNIVIAPAQTQMKFTASDMESNTIDYLVSCINNFLNNAKTPVLAAYGFNCEYTENNSIQFAEMLDAIPDNSKIIRKGYTIENTKLSRTLKKNGTTLNIESSQEGTKTKIHFNEHYGEPVTAMPEIKVDMINNFLLSAKELIVALGYELEGVEE